MSILGGILASILVGGIGLFFMFVLILNANFLAIYIYYLLPFVSIIVLWVLKLAFGMALWLAILLSPVLSLVLVCIIACIYLDHFW